MDKGALMDRMGIIDGQDRLLMAKVLDRGIRSMERDAPLCTDFLSPRQQAQARDLLRLAGVPDAVCVFDGGHPETERKILLFVPEWMDADQVPRPIRCLRASYRQQDPPGHRGLLGSLIAQGVAREKLGDIFADRESADLLVIDTVADYLLQDWAEAGRARLRVTEIDPSEIRIPPARFQEIRDTVSSTRLDAVIASGFRMARSKAAGLISTGRAQVDFREVTKPDQILKRDAVVSVRGHGKIRLCQIGDRTRKGRIPIIIWKYL